MRMVNVRILALMALLAGGLILSSCASGPTSQAQDAPRPIAEAPTPAAPEPIATPAPVETKPPVQQFDPKAVTEVVKTATFVDVRALIESLNGLVRKQDYDAWLSHLTKGYIAFYSDPDILAKYSESPIIKRKGVKMLTLRDYFVNVVYPSHQNDKVDDIEFVDENLIKAITVSPKGDRNILYMLEKHGDAWMIGIGR
jgi:hypothetical protein